MINFVVATESRWRRSGAVRFHTPSLPQKLARAFSRPGVAATPILAPEITWWHGKGDCGCSRFKLWIAFNEQNIGCCGKNGGIMLWNCGLCMRRECRECLPATACATHVPWCMSGSLTNSFIWGQWRVKRSRHSPRMRNPQFYLSIWQEAHYLEIVEGYWT